MVVPFTKILLFSKYLITFIIYFASLFFTVIPEPSSTESPFLLLLFFTYLLFLLKILRPVSTKTSLKFFLSVGALFLNSFLYDFVIDPTISNNTKKLRINKSFWLHHLIQLNFLKNFISWWTICKSFTKPWNLCISQQ